MPTSPDGTVSALRFRSEQSQLAQFGANITDGLSRLSASDDALTQTSHMTQRIRTQTIAALNGTLGPNERKAIADEIRPPTPGLGGNGGRSTSSPVKTATTPGNSRASSVSISVIRACAIGLRT